MTSKVADEAREIVRNYTLLAMTAGAVPLPVGPTAAIVGLNAAMISHVAAKYGKGALTYQSVAGTLGVAGAVNIGGRALFVELLRFIASFSFQWWSIPLVCVMGAITAGGQTWILGNVAIAMAESERNLTKDEVRRRVAAAKSSFGDVADAYQRGERGKKED